MVEVSNIICFGFAGLFNRIEAKVHLNLQVGAKLNGQPIRVGRLLYKQVRWGWGVPKFIRLSNPLKELII